MVYGVGPGSINPVIEDILSQAICEKNTQVKNASFPSGYEVFRCRPLHSGAFFFGDVFEEARHGVFMVEEDCAVCKAVSKPIPVRC